MTASAALGVLPEWNLADLYAAPDAPEFKADMDRGEADARAGPAHMRSSTMSATRPTRRAASSMAT